MVRIFKGVVSMLIKCLQMYIPRKFQMRTDSDWLPDVTSNPLATVISPDNIDPCVCHIPVAIIATESQRIAIGHVSRENPIWKTWGEERGQTCLVFTGPNAYVSPLTYQDAIQVPTWNYIAVHLKGHPHPVHFDENPSDIHDIMDTLITQFEPEYLPVWRALDLVNQENLLRGIVGFRMPITAVECVEKLSQNRTQRDAEAIADALATAGEATFATRMLEVRK
jgi:transcriptional regulator